MAKVRVVLAEMEGSDEGVLAAIQSFVGPALAEQPVSATLKVIAVPALDAPRALLSASAPVVPAEPQAAPRNARGAGKPKRMSASAPAPAAHAPVSDTGVVAAVVAVLAKGPLTSAHVVTKSGYSDGSVYPALKRLREEGRVEMIQDEADGLRKNKLKAT